MTSTADVAAKLKELPDGAYVFMVDNQGNPKDPVSNILSVENPDNQFYVKYSGLRDDVKDNLKHAIGYGSQQKKAEEKIERLQILLALLVGVYLVVLSSRVSKRLHNGAMTAPNSSLKMPRVSGSDVLVYG